jgi:hypothetical protein
LSHLIAYVMFTQTVENFFRPVSLFKNCI